MPPKSIDPQRASEPLENAGRVGPQLREDLRRIELYTGTLVSLDGNSTAILIAAASATGRGFSGNCKESSPRGNRRNRRDGGAAAESLLGIHILEDLGVPQKLLGAGTRSRAEQTGWKMPANLHELKLFVARRIGLVPVAILVMALVFFLHVSQRAGHAGPAARPRGDADVGFRSDGLGRRADLPHDGRDAGAAGGDGRDQ